MLKGKHWLLASILILVAIGWTGCRGPRVVWDQPNKNLHGKEVTFSNRMSYVTLTISHKEYGFCDEEITIGKTLTASESTRQELIVRYGGIVSIVDEQESFQIIGSYVRKYGWLLDSFRQDGRYALVRDRDGGVAIASFYEFSDSSLPNLSEINWLYGNID